MLIGIIIISATGLLAMTFSMLGRAGHPRLVGTFSGFLNVILFFPSGAIYPVESFPPWLRAFARYNPETHSVSAIKQILFKGADFQGSKRRHRVPADLHGVDAGARQRVVQADALTYHMLWSLRS